MDFDTIKSYMQVNIVQESELVAQHFNRTDIPKNLCVLPILVRSEADKHLLVLCRLIWTFRVQKGSLPASIAFRAATLKSLTTKGISSVSKRLGTAKVATSIPLALTWGFSGLSVLEIGACPLGWNAALEHLTLVGIMALYLKKNRSRNSMSALINILVYDKHS